jgi:hypothetical protein
MLFRGLFIAFIKNKFRVLNAAERNLRSQGAQISDFAAERNSRARDTDRQMQPKGAGVLMDTDKCSRKEQEPSRVQTASLRPKLTEPV